MTHLDPTLDSAAAYSETNDYAPAPVAEQAQARYDVVDDDKYAAVIFNADSGDYLPMWEVVGLLNNHAGSLQAAPAPAPKYAESDVDELVDAFKSFVQNMDACYAGAGASPYSISKFVWKRMPELRNALAALEPKP